MQVSNIFYSEITGFTFQPLQEKEFILLHFSFKHKLSEPINSRRLEILNFNLPCFLLLNSII